VKKVGIHLRQWTLILIIRIDFIADLRIMHTVSKDFMVQKKKKYAVMKRRRIIRYRSLRWGVNWGVTPCVPKVETAGVFRNVGVLL
jgi:hypothetical protein